MSLLAFLMLVFVLFSRHFRHAWNSPSPPPQKKLDVTVGEVLAVRKRHFQTRSSFCSLFLTICCFLKFSSPKAISCKFGRMQRFFTATLTSQDLVGFMGKRVLQRGSHHQKTLLVLDNNITPSAVELTVGPQHTNCTRWGSGNVIWEKIFPPISEHLGFLKS